jgi:hypothetical protein
MELKRRLSFIGLAIGVFISFQVTAVAQEKIFKSDYDGRKFSFPVLITSLECLSFAIIAGGKKFIKTLLS